MHGVSSFLAIQVTTFTQDFKCIVCPFRKAKARNEKLGGCETGADELGGKIALSSMEHQLHEPINTPKPCEVPQTTTPSESRTQECVLEVQPNASHVAQNGIISPQNCSSSDHQAASSMEDDWAYISRSIQLRMGGKRGDRVDATSSSGSASLSTLTDENMFGASIASHSAPFTSEQDDNASHALMDCCWSTGPETVQDSPWGDTGSDAGWGMSDRPLHHTSVGYKYSVGTSLFAQHLRKSAESECIAGQTHCGTLQDSVDSESIHNTSVAALDPWHFSVVGEAASSAALPANDCAGAIVPNDGNNRVQQQEPCHDTASSVSTLTDEEEVPGVGGKAGTAVSLSVPTHACAREGLATSFYDFSSGAPTQESFAGKSVKLKPHEIIVAQQMECGGRQTTTREAVRLDVSKVIRPQMNSCKSFKTDADVVEAVAVCSSREDSSGKGFVSSTCILGDFGVDGNDAGQNTSTGSCPNLHCIGILQPGSNTGRRKAKRNKKKGKGKKY